MPGLFGRIAFGLLGDRFGAKRVLVLGLLAQAFGALGYVFVRELAAFYAVAALFGFIYAGTMPLYSVLSRAKIFRCGSSAPLSAARPWPAASAWRRDRWPEV